MRLGDSDLGASIMRHLGPAIIAPWDRVDTDRLCPVQTISDGDYGRLFAARGIDAPAGIADGEFEARLRDIAEARRRGHDDPPAEGGPNIPAGYTYLGQFVVHDLTRSERRLEGGEAVMRNLRTAELDLDSVYGGGPAACPHLYRAPRDATDRPHEFYLGRTAPPLSRLNWHVGSGLPLDLPRIDEESSGILVNGTSRRSTPLIIDDRNDEHLVIAQLHAIFLLIHNRAANHLLGAGFGDSAQCFEQARCFVTTCYRQIVIHDYLARLLPKPFHDDLTSPHPTFLPPDPGPVSVEFAFAVARIGHCMARGRYKLNDHVDIVDSALGRLLMFSHLIEDADLPLPSDWVLDWGRFFDLPGRTPQSARRINPSMVPLFVDAPRLVPLASEIPHQQIAFRDLWRPYQFGIASGQDCARELRQRLPHAIEVPVLEGEDIKPRAPFANARLAQAIDRFPHFAAATPLSYYVAQEAALLGNAGAHLGPVGAFVYAAAARAALGDLAARPPRGIRTMPDFLRLPYISPSEFVAAMRETIN